MPLRPPFVYPPQLFPIYTIEGLLFETFTSRERAEAVTATSPSQFQPLVPYTLTVRVPTP